MLLESLRNASTRWPILELFFCLLVAAAGIEGPLTSSRVQLGEIAIGADASFERASLAEAPGVASLGELSSLVADSASANGAASTMMRREATPIRALETHLTGARKSAEAVVPPKLAKLAKKHHFDCKEGLDNWQKGWSKTKMEFCCESLDIACQVLNDADDKKKAKNVEKENKKVKKETEDAQDTIKKMHAKKKASEDKDAKSEQKHQANMKKLDKEHEKKMRDIDEQEGEADAAAKPEPVLEPAVEAAPAKNSSDTENSADEDQDAQDQDTQDENKLKEAEEKLPVLKVAMDRKEAEDKVRATWAESRRLQAMAHIEDGTTEPKSKEDPNDSDIETKEEELALIGFGALAIILCSGGVFYYKSRQEEAAEKAPASNKSAEVPPETPLRDGEGLTAPEGGEAPPADAK